MSFIPLFASGGELHGWTRVDARDFVWLRRLAWRLTSSGYAWRHLNEDGERQRVLMHREILGLRPGDGLEGDHINGDKLDNRRCNLRRATRAENAQNLRTTPKSSRFRGVCRASDGRRWQAQAWTDGRSHHLGRFDTEEEAAETAARFRAEHMPFSTDAQEAKAK